MNAPLRVPASTRTCVISDRGVQIPAGTPGDHAASPPQGCRWSPIVYSLILVPSARHAVPQVVVRNRCRALRPETASRLLPSDVTTSPGPGSHRWRFSPVFSGSAVHMRKRFSTACAGGRPRLARVCVHSPRAVSRPSSTGSPALCTWRSTSRPGYRAASWAVRMKYICAGQGPGCGVGAGAARRSLWAERAALRSRPVRRHVAGSSWTSSS